MNNAFEIREVAIYLRKSRGEDYKDLEKHSIELIDLAENNGWKYVIYKEIASGDSLNFRPKMLELLSDINNDYYDAVLVMDYDRLGRGDEVDAAIIRDTFKSKDTLIITPQKVFDLKNDSDEMLSEFLGFMARFEYRQIKKRLYRGKKIGLKLGRWVNGPAPFPYEYNSIKKRLEINPKKYKVYETIKKKIKEGESLTSITTYLNNNGYKTNRNKNWSVTAIRRILTNQVHLGHTVFGKTKGSGHKNRKTQPFKHIPVSEWIIVKNTHEPVLTEEEYKYFNEIFERNKNEHIRYRMHARKYSSLIKCGKCGYARSFVKKYNANGDEVIFIKTCQKIIPHSNLRCGNGGGKEEYVDKTVLKELKAYKEKLKRASVDFDFKETLSIKYDSLLNQLEKEKIALRKVMELYEEGDYSKKEYIERKLFREKNILEIENKLYNLKNRIDYYESMDKEYLIKNIKYLINNWNHINDSTLNRNLKHIIDKIYFTRNDNNEIDIEIVFR